MRTKEQIKRNMNVCKEWLSDIKKGSKCPDKLIKIAILEYQIARDKAQLED